MPVWCRQILGALVFYTVLPLPHAWPLEFRRLARWAPLVGLLLGGLLWLTGLGLQELGFSVALNGWLLALLWLWLTGGLHLDGAMDTADGLAVPDPERRLAVMADSRSGAFGVMVAIALLALKATALASLIGSPALVAVPVWGRWAQVLAVARFPYLRAEGKGALHRRDYGGWPDWLPGLCLALVASALPLLTRQPASALRLLLGGLLLAWIVPGWFGRRLGGHTGDSYGATVEWTEALLLVLLAAG